MNKEQILQKFDEILLAKHYKFSEDGVLKSKYVLQEDIEELMALCFNLGLEVAADNAEADYTFVQVENFPEEEFEVYILKNSILKFKL